MATYAPKLAAPASADDFADELALAAAEAGFSHYLLIRFGDDALIDVLNVLHNAPPESNGLLQTAGHWSVGRLLERLRRQATPIHFDRDAPGGLELPGYRSGVVALSRGRVGGVVLCFGSDAPGLDTSRLISMMGQVLVAASNCTAAFASLYVHSCPLTPMELACLEQALKGLSSKQTAQLLEISHRTVEHHLERCRKRCTTRTTMAAAYYAVHRGWLQMPAGDELVSAG